MKRIVFYLAFALFVITAYGQDKKQEKKQEKKHTAAVLDFHVISGIDQNEALALTSRFRTSFSQTKKYVVLERNEMDQILKAQDFSLTDVCNSSECAVQLGKLLAAEKIVSGDIGKVGATYTISVRLIDVTTGGIEETVNQEYKGKSDGLLGAFDIVAQKISGTYVASSRKWIWIGGAVAAGGVTSLLLMKKSGSGTYAIGNPPTAPPTIP